MCRYCNRDLPETPAQRVTREQAGEVGRLRFAAELIWLILGTLFIVNRPHGADGTWGRGFGDLGHHRCMPGWLELLALAGEPSEAPLSRRAPERLRGGPDLRRCWSACCGRLTGSPRGWAAGLLRHLWAM